MTLLQKRKLRLIVKRIIRNNKQRKLYILNTHWLKIKKQKLRRRKRTFIKLWKLKRLNTIKRYQLAS
jgi:hypothetical protein